MKSLAPALAFAVACCATGSSSTSKRSPSPAPASTGSFLQRLVGDWEYEADAVNGPGQPVTRLKGVEHGRMLGPWAVLETDGETPNGRFTGLLTVGPEPGGKRYVGTWISSVQDTLVQYEGTLDEPAGTLTLEAKLPDPSDPAKQVKYRDVIRLQGDGKEITSMMEADGKWVTFLTGHYRRR